jgi:hypothetical protein
LIIWDLNGNIIKKIETNTTEPYAAISLTQNRILIGNNDYNLILVKGEEI